MYATASPFSLFRETRSSFLSIFCLFAYSMSISALYTHTRLPSRTAENLKRRSTIQDQINSLSTCRKVFSPLSLIVGNRITTIVFSVFHFHRIIYHEKKSVVTPIDEQAEGKRSEEKKIITITRKRERERAQKNREEKKGGTFSSSTFLNSVDKRKRFV